MDKVRFGRALGTGAREAAKALLKAVDAAAAPDPAHAPKPPVRRAPAVTVEKPRVATGAVRVADRAKTARAGFKEGGKRFGEAAWAPLAKAGAVLWLEVTGVLFGLFAAVAGVAAWQDRRNFRVGGPAERHAWLALGMFAVFAYFTVTSYTRAARRGKR